MPVSRFREQVEIFDYVFLKLFCYFTKRREECMNSRGKQRRLLGYRARECFIELFLYSDNDKFAFLEQR